MKRFRFTLHNVFGHPLMECAHILGMPRAARWIHRVTLPWDLWETGRLMMEVEAAEYFDETMWLSEKELESIDFIREARALMEGHESGEVSLREVNDRIRAYKEARRGAR